MRSALCIGVDQYQCLKRLYGAESDAHSVYDSLIGEADYHYRAQQSKLLLSPTLDDLRTGLTTCLYSVEPVAVFTFYFAGHAQVIDETLYLGFAETDLDRLPITAIAFPELLRMVTGAHPKQINFVIDACNAGGLGYDIAGALKRHVVGTADSTGLAFLAAAAADEFANETKSGGVFTSQFVQIVQGRKFVQNYKPFLDLVEIGQAIELADEGQTVSSWALNLQGRNLFALNPHYSGPSAVTDRVVAKLTAGGSQTQLRHIRELRSALSVLSETFDERKFAPILSNAISEATEKTELLFGLAQGFRPQLMEAEDPYLEARVLSVFAGQIVAYADGSSDEKSLFRELVDWIRKADRRAIEATSRLLEEEGYALIHTSVLSELYYLPLRISDILGRLGLFLFSNPSIPPHEIELLRKFVIRLLAQYGNSVLAYSDDQAVGFTLFLSACRLYKFFDEAEEVVGRLFLDLHENYGRVGGYSLGNKEILQLIHERHTMVETPRRDIYNSPSDLATVILSFAALLNLDDAIDTSLINLDHLNINFFVPDEMQGLGKPGTLNGANYTLTVGREFWRCIDLRRILRSDILPMYKNELTSDEAFLIAAATLALRNRIPWHVLS